MLKTLFAASAFSFAALALTAPASAAADSRAPSVGYADLDLSRADHAALLDNRLEAAATDACGKPFIRDMKGMVSFNACVADAMAGAKQKIAAPLPTGIELASR